MTCPITFNYYQTVSATYVTNGHWTFLSEDVADDFKELKFEINQDDPTEQTQALRAFYALEYMYFHLLPLKIKSAEYMTWKVNFMEQFERSCEGLEILMRLCEQLKRRLVVDKGTMSLMQRDASGFTKDTLDKPLWIIDAIRDGAERLHKHMSGRMLSLAPFGKTFGSSMQYSNQSLERCGDITRTLLSISIHNPVSPCNTTIRSLG